MSRVRPFCCRQAKHAHGIGLTSGWYGNNCDCSDHCDKAANASHGQGPICDLQIKGDVAALVTK